MGSRIAGPIAVNPGPHVFEVAPPRGARVPYRIVARRGDKNRRLRVTVPPRVPDHVWALAGLGALDLGAAGYFFFRGHWADDEEAVRVANAAVGVSLGMAVVSIGAAGWFYLSRPPASWSEPGKKPPAKVGLRLRGPMIELAGQF